MGSAVRPSEGDAYVAGEVRQRMIEGAAQLLAQKGLQATSFSEVLEFTGAPRGSVYHHFPEGKDQLVGSAIELASQRMHGYLDSKAGASAFEITEYFLYLWSQVLLRSHFHAGCAVLAVTVATDSTELMNQTATIFRTWRHRLADLLEQGGLSTKDATRFAAALVAASEGAVVMSRAEQSMEPFDLVTEQLLDQVRILAEKPASGE
jgi:TetR/AcrR family transcriptional regulator, lmrAB and yxaGH operons repressor